MDLLTGVTQPHKVRKIFSSYVDFSGLAGTLTAFSEFYSL